MTDKPKAKLADIKLLVLDVDGVLTDGTLTINGDGSESKSFNSLDGHGIKMWRKAGLKVGFLSGRLSSPTKYRAEQLGVDYVFEDCHDKLPVMKKLLGEDTNIRHQQFPLISSDLQALSRH